MLMFADCGSYAKIDTAQVDIMIPTLETTGSVGVEQESILNDR